MLFRFRWRLCHFRFSFIAALLYATPCHTLLILIFDIVFILADVSLRLFRHDIYA